MPLSFLWRERDFDRTVSGGDEVDAGLEVGERESDGFVRIRQAPEGAIPGGCG
jgi:hypothetical protein